MAKRKKPRAARDNLSEFVVDVASGDMPIESVIRADKGTNPAADALRRMKKNQRQEGSLREAKAAGRLRAAPKGEKPQGLNLTVERYLAAW